MNNDEFVSEQLLGSPFKLVNTAIIFKNLFDGVRIAHPVKNVPHKIQSVNVRKH